MALQQIVFIALSSCYFILALLAISQLQRVCRDSASKGSQRLSRASFFIFILLNCIVRGVFFVINADSNLVQNITSWAFFALNVLPSPFLFSTYLLLVLFWAEIYHQSTQHVSSIPTLRRTLNLTFIILNAVLYIILVTLLILVGIALSANNPDTYEVNSLENAITIYIAGLALSVSAVFLFYGSRVYKYLNRFPIASQRRQLQMRKIGLTTATCVASFFIRSCIIVITNLKDVSLSPLSILLYYGVLELLPTLLLIVVMWKNPRIGGSQSNSLLAGQSSRLTASAAEEGPEIVGGSGLGNSGFSSIHHPNNPYNSSSLPASSSYPSSASAISNGVGILRNDSVGALASSQHSVGFAGLGAGFDRRGGLSYNTPQQSGSNFGGRSSISGASGYGPASVSGPSSRDILSILDSYSPYAKTSSSYRSYNAAWPQKVKDDQDPQ